jgi:hypothetical protein
LSNIKPTIINNTIIRAFIIKDLFIIGYHFVLF